jgi:hypothetical protein
MKEKVRTVIKGDELSAANHVFPVPSGPAGQSIFLMSPKPACDDEGDPSTWEFCKGTGTREEENGDAPAEKGTLGLLVPFKTAFPLPKAVTKDPVKNRLASEELVVIEVT